MFWMYRWQLVTVGDIESNLLFALSVWWSTSHHSRPISHLFHAFPSPSHAYSLYDGQPTLVNNVRHKMINYNGEKWFFVTLWQINYTKCICNMTAYIWKWNMTNQQVIDHVPGVFWTQEVVHIGVDVRYAVWWSVQENVINGRREFL